MVDWNPTREDCGGASDFLSPADRQQMWGQFGRVKDFEREVMGKWPEVIPDRCDNKSLVDRCQNQAEWEVLYHTGEPAGVKLCTQCKAVFERNPHSQYVGAKYRRIKKH